MAVDTRQALRKYAHDEFRALLHLARQGLTYTEAFELHKLALVASVVKLGRFPSERARVAAARDQGFERLAMMEAEATSLLKSCMHKMPQDTLQLSEVVGVARQGQELARMLCVDVPTSLGLLSDIVWTYEKNPAAIVPHTATKR